MEKILAVLDYFELLLLIFQKYFKRFQNSSPFQIKMLELTLNVFAFSQQISLSVVRRLALKSIENFN